MLPHHYSYQLQNIEDGTVIVYYTNHGSRWINKLSEAEEWLREEEVKRLDANKIKRPTIATKWEFVSFFNVDVKVVLDREPLLGTGPLPEWLRNLPLGEEGQWIPIKITCVYGVVSQCTEAHYHIEEQTKHAV